MNPIDAEIDLTKFKKKKRISKGGFGVVYTVEEKKTGKLFAAKIIDCDDDEKICNQMINREISIMMYARHPTIIKFIGYSKLDFQEENNITIIMELAKNGSLRNVINSIQEGNGPLDYTNTSRQIILVGVARGMKFLHDRSIIHRDLKTDNILLDENFHPHITDFGLSKFIEAGHTRSQTKFGGTLPYEAPEILQGLRYDQKVDVYAFGILMFEVLTDTFPYPELLEKEFNLLDFANKIINKNYRPKFTVPVKKSFKKLIRKCWSKDPEERPSFGEIFTILSNKNDQDYDEEDEDEDFMLDDVDVDEFNLYVKSITKATDSTEKLMSKMSKIEIENKRLKDEVKKLKSKLGTPCIMICGRNYKNILGEKPNNKHLYCGHPAISPPVKLSVDPSSLRSYSSYCWNSVMVMSDGSLKGIGDNIIVKFTLALPMAHIDHFTDFCIKDDNGHKLSAISAVCCTNGALYLLSKSNGRGRQLLYCDKYKSDKYLDIGNHQPVSLFGGHFHSAAICSEGEVILHCCYSYFYNFTYKTEVVYLPDGEKASSVACCNDSVVVLSSNGRLFISPVNKKEALKFSPVSELEDEEIICVSGTNEHFLAVSKEGRVFGCGSNDCGRLGLGNETKKVSSFTRIQSLIGYKIRAAYAGLEHSLFETREGKILSCGSNSWGELLLSSGPGEDVYSPTETVITRGASFCIAGCYISLVFIGDSPPPNTPNQRVD